MLTNKMKKFLIIIFLLIAARSDAAWVIIANGNAKSTNSGASVTTIAANTTGADLIILTIGYYSASVAPTDNLSNTWHALTAHLSGTAEGVKLYYATKFDGSFAVGSAQTFTTTSDFPSISWAAFSGSLTTSSPFDSQNGGTATTGTTVTSGGSVGVSGELVVAGLGGNYSTGTPTINNSFTLTNYSDYATANAEGSALAYLSTTGATNPTYTSSVSFIGAGIAIASFLPASGGGGGCTAPPGQLLLIGVGNCAGD
jgi:hypothetical protein